MLLDVDRYLRKRGRGLDQRGQRRSDVVGAATDAPDGAKISCFSVSALLTTLSLISLVAYVLTKMAVGIFAGGVVFSVLLPELNWFGLDSFWIGSAPWRAGAFDL